VAGESSELPAQQQGKGGSDAYVAGRDIHYHVDAGGRGPAPAPEPVRRIWGGVPARNPGFRGREDLLQAVHDALAGGDRAVVQALHGIGGVGKTQIAIEYTHRFAAAYDLGSCGQRRHIMAHRNPTLTASGPCRSTSAFLQVRAVLRRVVTFCVPRREQFPSLRQARPRPGSFHYRSPPGAKRDALRRGDSSRHGTSRTSR
jgi:hypothetical protein